MELYLYSPCTPSWRGQGQLYFYDLATTERHNPRHLRRREINHTQIQFTARASTSVTTCSDISSKYVLRNVTVRPNRNQPAVMVMWFIESRLANEFPILPTKTLDSSNTALDPSLSLVYLQEVSGDEPNLKQCFYMVNCKDNGLTR